MGYFCYIAVFSYLYLMKKLIIIYLIIYNFINKLSTFFMYNFYVSLDSLSRI